ncbi:helix-turn-helix domain-containing protein [Wukongibacter sp. M2B1]|uniref:helix-turn-helix domain-containing protein n=1 Tax=Wukongibacter sp. M2B1 TaxID=3088895 RepID=UPI003D795A0B
MNIGEYIKQLRNQRKLSINQLGIYSKVSPAHISRIERGLREPSPDVLKKLSNILKVSYEDLMKVAGYLDNNLNNESLPLKSDNPEKYIQDEYLELAKEMQDKKIDVEDVRKILEVLRKNK